MLIALLHPNRKPDWDDDNQLTHSESRQTLLFSVIKDLDSDPVHFYALLTDHHLSNRDFQVRLATAIRQAILAQPRPNTPAAPPLTAPPRKVTNKKVRMIKSPYKTLVILPLIWQPSNFLRVGSFPWNKVPKLDSGLHTTQFANPSQASFAPSIQNVNREPKPSDELLDVIASAQRHMKGNVGHTTGRYFALFFAYVLTGG